MINEESPLDYFLFDIIKNEKEEVLDYGCGQGRFIEFCKDRNLKIFGADTYEGIYTFWNFDSDSIFKISDNRIPVGDESFRVVLSNQVLEHIPPNLVASVAREITRLIKIGGYGIRIFPTRKTIIEPHVGLFGAHWFKSGSKIQFFYLRMCHIIGFGCWRLEMKRGGKPNKTGLEWARASSESLKNHCFYVPVAK
jgi:SAM-dependent methyltransferase